MRRATALLATCLLLTLGACSSDDDGGGGSAAPSPPPAADVDDGGEADPGDAGDGEGIACDLLTVDEVEAAGWAGVEGPVRNERSPGDECRFEDETGSALVVHVYAESEAVALGPTTYDPSEELDGIGDSAWYASGLRLAQARLGDGRVVSVQGLSEGGGRDGLVELLAIAAG